MVYVVSVLCSDWLRAIVYFDLLKHTYTHSLWFTAGLKITIGLSGIHVELFWNKRLRGFWVRDTCVHAGVRARVEWWVSRRPRWRCWTRKEVNDIQRVWEGVWDVYWETETESAADQFQKYSHLYSQGWDSDQLEYQHLVWVIYWRKLKKK